GVAARPGADPGVRNKAAPALAQQYTGTDAALDSLDQFLDGPALWPPPPRLARGLSVARERLARRKEFRERLRTNGAQLDDILAFYAETTEALLDATARAHGAERRRQAPSTHLVARRPRGADRAREPRARPPRVRVRLDAVPARVVQDAGHGRDRAKHLRKCVSFERSRRHRARIRRGRSVLRRHRSDCDERQGARDDRRDP